MRAGEWLGSFLRFKYNADARAAHPADICTTVPPAKSSTPSLLKIPSGCQVTWANGENIKMANRHKKIMYELNRIRPAKAPVISAGVMMANFNWYMANNSKGIVGASFQVALPSMPFIIK